MKNFHSVALVAGFLLLAGCVPDRFCYEFPSETQVRNLYGGRISLQEFRAIGIAAAELPRHQLNAERYREISVQAWRADKGERLAVLFYHRKGYHQYPDGSAYPGEPPDFRVDLSVPELTIVGAGFANR